MAARGLENHKELRGSDGILDVEQLPIRPTQETTEAALGKLCSGKNYKNNAPPGKNVEGKEIFLYFVLNVT